MTAEPFDPARLVRLLAADDPAAAGEMDALADRLRAAAAAYRAAHANPDPGFVTPSGCADRVIISVTGPGRGDPPCTT